MKNKKANIAVSELLGALLMLGLVVSSFSAINYFVISAPTPNPPPSVEISGSLRDNKILLMHRGGEFLSLNTEIVVNLGNATEKLKVGDYLDGKSKLDNKWGLGEQISYPIFYDFNYQISNQADITVVDKGSNSVIMTGLIYAIPSCDISVEINVTNLNPKENENVEFTITVFNHGNINASGVAIEFLLPEGLIYYNSTVEQGSYNNSTGIWDIGQILPKDSVYLIVEATIGDVIFSSPTQLAVLLDGSDSISSSDWGLILKGLSTAVNDSRRFPHDGVIELTIIQFGGKKPAYAQLEIGPIVITESNFINVVNDIQNIIQIGDKTPTSCAVYLAADILANSDMFDPDIRQVIMLVTDGNPTHSCASDGDYADNNDDAVGPKDAVIVARDYLVDLLSLNENNDEFNSLAVQLTGIGHSVELKENVVWPSPGYYFPDEYSKYASYGGWVRNVSSWEEFADSINESFDVIFNNILVEVNIKSTGFSDPKEVNDKSSVELKILPPFA